MGFTHFKLKPLLQFVMTSFVVNVVFLIKAKMCYGIRKIQCDIAVLDGPYVARLDFSRMLDF
eukprot:m.516723 g.516723  ORF g.516723 m.516723 type:complete len:62 (-) comp21931_c0_seq2:2320-2505(-)